MKIKTILLAAAMVLPFTGCHDSTPSDAVAAFYRTWQQQGIHEALAFTNLPEEERERTARAVSETGMSVLRFEILDSHIEEGDSAAFVKLRLVTAGAASDTMRNDLDIPCVKAGGVWKVRFI